MPDFNARIYCPNIRTFPEATAQQRAAVLTTEIAAANAAGIEIFIAPEYFFTHKTSTLPDPTGCIAYTAEEESIVRDLLLKCSAQFPNMLIVAGTTFMVQGVSTPTIFNTSFVYCGGRKLAECSKSDTAADPGYARLCKLPYHSGDVAVAFTYRGISCYLQICADTVVAPPVGQNYDLNLVPAFLPGAAALSNASRFKYRLLSDGAGRYVFTWNNNQNRATGVGPIYDAVLTIP